METNNGDKRLLFAGLFVFALVYFIYDYYTNPCSFYNQFFLVDCKAIDKKYVYTINKGKIEDTYCTSACNSIKYIVGYPNDYDDSTMINNENIRWIKSCSYLEILKYNYKDSIAFVKFYYSGISQRINKEQYTMVSMKCLHDTLPTGYTEYKE